MQDPTTQELALDPTLRQSIINLLVVVISIFAAALTTWWQQHQTKKDVAVTKKDLDALADKQRATDKEVGIQTRWNPTTREVYVTRDPNSPGQPTSAPPAPLGNQPSGQSSG